MSTNYEQAREKANFRVGGSAFTSFIWQGKTIALARGVADAAPRPVADPVAIQPMDQRYPMDIITPAALKEGRLTISIFEKYQSRVWDDLLTILSDASQIPKGGYPDLVSIFIALAAMEKPVHCIKVIQPPNRLGKTVQPYGDVYLNCKIVDIGDNENIEIGTMEVVKNIVVAYTRKVRTDGNTNSQFETEILNSDLADVRTPILGI